MTIITQGPTLANPEAFNTVAELRAALHLANSDLLAYSAALEERDAVGRQFSGFINRVLMQHLRGDHRGVAAILDAQLESSPRLREHLEEANESNEIRQAQQWDEAAQADSQPEPLPPYNCGGDDPWSLKTQQELRQALDVANRAGARIASENASLKGVLKDMTAEISKIVVAHVKGDRDAVSRAVTAFCEKHVVVKDGDKSKVH